MPKPISLNAIEMTIEYYPSKPVRVYRLFIMLIKSLDVHNDSEADEIIVDSPNNSKVLCEHCGRTSTNGVKCIGKCVADSNY